MAGGVCRQEVRDPRMRTSHGPREWREEPVLGSGLRGGPCRSERVCHQLSICLRRQRAKDVQVRGQWRPCLWSRGGTRSESSAPEPPGAAEHGPCRQTPSASAAPVSALPQDFPSPPLPGRLSLTQPTGTSPAEPCRASPGSAEPVPAQQSLAQPRLSVCHRGRQALPCRRKPAEAGFLLPAAPSPC